jgi:ELWxxDGT repeat protein
MTPMGPGEVFFTATTATHGREFWQTDGTAAGTFRLTDLNPGPADAIPFDPAYQDGFPVANGHTCFPANAPATGTEAYTKAYRITNVRLAADHTPGPNGSGPIQFGTHGGKFVYVAGQDLVVWAPGAGSDRVLATGMDRARAEHSGVGNWLTFSYSTPQTGHELHASHLGAVAVPYGEGSDAAFQFRLEGTPPILGRNLTLRGTTPTDGGVSLKFLGLAAHNWVPAGAGNRLYLDPTGPLVPLGAVPVNGRIAEYSTFIGNDPALVGAQAAVQAIQITPNLDVFFSNPVGLSLSTL